MTYKDYPNYTKTFVVVHNTGFGVMEAPYVEKEVVFETDDEAIALSEAQRLTAQNNESDCGSWKSNTYWVNVNTLSVEGKKLEEKFTLEGAERIKQGLAEGKYNVQKIGDVTYYSDKSFDKFFEESEGNKPLSSSKFIIMDLSEGNKGSFPTRVLWSKPKK